MTDPVEILYSHALHGVEWREAVRLSFVVCSCGWERAGGVRKDHAAHQLSELISAGIVCIERAVLDQLQGKVDAKASGGQLYSYGPRPSITTDLLGS